MYASSLRVLEAELLAYRAGTKGMKWERRILGADDHKCPECIALARKGWRKYGTLTPIGDTVCKTNCKCRFEYSDSSTKPQ